MALDIHLEHLAPKWRTKGGQAIPVGRATGGLQWPIPGSLLQRGQVRNSGWFPVIVAVVHQRPGARLRSAGCKQVKQVTLNGSWLPRLLAVLVWDTLWNPNGPSTLKDCCRVTDPFGGIGEEVRDETQLVVPGRDPQELLGGSPGSNTSKKEPTHGPLTPKMLQRSVPALTRSNSASDRRTFPFCAQAESPSRALTRTTATTVRILDLVAGRRRKRQGPVMPASLGHPVDSLCLWERGA